MTSRFIDHGRCRCALVPAKPWHAPFTPDEIHAAEIEAAREEGRRAGMMEAAQIARAYGTSPGRCAAKAIEAKAKEG